MKWYRFYSDTLNDERWQMLTPEAFRVMVNLLSLSGSLPGTQRGTLPNARACAFRLRMNAAEFDRLLPELEEAKLIERASDGALILLEKDNHFKASDNSAERMADMRSRKRVNVTPRDAHSDRGVTPRDVDVTLRERERDREVREDGTAAVKPPVVEVVDGGLVVEEEASEEIELRWADEEKAAPAAALVPVQRKTAVENGRALATPTGTIVPSPAAAALAAQLGADGVAVWQAFNLARGAVKADGHARVVAGRIDAVKRAMMLGITPEEIVAATPFVPPTNGGMGEDRIINYVMAKRGESTPQPYEKASTANRRQLGRELGLAALKEQRNGRQ